MLLYISFKSKDFDKALVKISERISNMVMSVDDTENIVKLYTGSTIRMAEDYKAMHQLVINDLSIHNEFIINRISRYNKFTVKYLRKVKDSLYFTNQAISIIKPFES